MSFWLADMGRFFFLHSLYVGRFALIKSRNALIPFLNHLWVWVHVFLVLVNTNNNTIVILNSIDTEIDTVMSNVFSIQSVTSQNKLFSSVHVSLV